MSITVASETGAPLWPAVCRVLADGRRTGSSGTCRTGIHYYSSPTPTPPPPPGHYYLVTYLLPITPPHFLLSRPASLLPPILTRIVLLLAKRPPLEPGGPLRKNTMGSNLCTHDAALCYFKNTFASCGRWNFGLTPPWSPPTTKDTYLAR